MVVILVSIAAVLAGVIAFIWARRDGTTGAVALWVLLDALEQLFRGA